MKNREYFVKKFDSLRDELKLEIKKYFKIKRYESEQWYNYDNSNEISFLIDGIDEKKCEIDFIFISEDGNIEIFPIDKSLDPISLDEIMDIHNLMLLYTISTNEISFNEN